MRFAGQPATVVTSGKGGRWQFLNIQYGPEKFLLPVPPFYGNNVDSRNFVRPTVAYEIEKRETASAEMFNTVQPNLNQRKIGHQNHKRKIQSHIILYTRFMLF